MRNTTADLGGRELTNNYYYPSPEMHEDAAAALRETVKSRFPVGHGDLR
jgi:hypothetical protein